jgi:hypothetical protein
VLNLCTANPFVLNSKNYPQPAAPNPEPGLDVRPKSGDYVGAMKQSDREVLLAPMGSPPPAFPGSAMPGQGLARAPAPAVRGF